MLKYSSYQSIYTLPASEDQALSNLSNQVVKLSKIKGYKRFWRIFAITILFMLICTVAVKAFESPDTANNIENDMVIVQAGDTLWQLATQYKPEKWDTRAFIQVIQEANNLDSSVIHAGEVIAIPILD
jgi:cell division protein YceG involved in septum cleavage